MHMGNELLTPAVGTGLIFVSAAGIGYAARKARKELDERKVPMMGVIGAFVFAAQMINFPVLAGTSGHLGGGLLLALVLGPHIGTIVMASILIVQCLIFQDGGLLALGANIINMGLVPCYAGYFLYRQLAYLLKFKSGNFVSVFFASVIAVLLGAALVPVEVGIAGVFNVPFFTFLAVMLGVHLLIGLVEGAITVGVTGYIYKIRPEVIEWSVARAPKFSFKGLTVSIMIAALVVAGFFSYYASNHPDGLEWAAEKLGFSSEKIETESTLMEDVSLFPDYEVPDEGIQTEHPHLSRGIAGAVGTFVTLVIVVTVGWVIRRKTRIS